MADSSRIVIGLLAAHDDRDLAERDGTLRFAGAVTRGNLRLLIG
jgi:hypothetical protein